MRIVKHVGVATVLLMMSIVGLSQQLRLGKNPYALQKSAILELESDNQGLLFPRILDTTLINTLTPPDGMVIFHQPSRQLMVRSNGYWKALAPEASLSNYWTINGNSNGSVKKLGNIDNFDLSLITNNTERLRILANGNVGIGNNNPLQKLDVTGNMNISGAFMPSNNAGTTGYMLRSNGAGVAPSWINPLLSGLSDVTITTPANGQLLQYNGTKWINTTPAYLTTIDTSNISNFYQKVRGLLSAAAPLSFANGQFSLPKATTSVNGYLSSTDWTTFNNKLSSIDTSNISNFFLKVRNLSTAAAPITYANGQIGITQASASVNGYLSSTDWTTFNNKLSSIDTSNISNFFLKVRNLSTAAAPITYANGQIGITQASASANGYLSSADWNTFNNKAGNFSTGNLTETGSAILTIAGGTNAIVGSGVSIQVKQATAVQNGFLSSADWTTFNNKLSTIDTTNISNFYQKVRGLSTASAPITYANGQIGITQASTSTNGYLSSADWNTFNNKAGNFSTGNLTESGSGILTITGGTNAIVGSGVSIQVKQATAVQNGFLSSADWTTFNNKLSSIDTTNISNFSQKVRKLLSGGTGISYNNTTGAITNTGVTSLNGNTGALTMDTGYINNFYLKSRGLLSAGTGITYNATTGVISSSITTGNLWNLSGNAGTTPASQFLGTTDAQDLSFRTNNAERMRLDAAGRLGIGTTTPASALHVAGTNPLTLNGVQTGAATDSLLTIEPSGTVKKMKASDIINVSAITNLNGLTAGTQTFAVGTAGTDFNISSSSPVHTFNLPSASATARGLVTTTAQTIAGSKTFSSAPLFSSLTTGSVPFIGTGGLLSQNNSSFFWDATNNRLGIGTNAPGSDLTLSQSAGGAGPTKGFRFTGNSISGFNGGTGFSLTLGYNITNNKQLWLGDADYLGNGTGTFVRYSSTNGQTILDGIDGTNAIRRPISIGVGGDPNSAVILGSDGSSASPVSYIWANGEMAIGSGFRNNDAPTNGLSVQGSVAIGSSALDATYPEKLLVDAGVTTSVNAIAAKGTIDSYLQLNIQNKSGGTSASSDIVATANNGSETSNYIDMGINGSAYSGGVMGGSNDGYIYNLGQNLLIGTGTASKSLVFMTGGTAQGTNERMRIDGTGNVGINTTTPNSGAKLDVHGTVKLGAKGTVEKNVISFEISFASNTTVPGASMNTLFSTFSPGALETTVTIPAANTPTTTRGSVSISADQDLPSNVSIASARISSTTGVKVRFLNSGTGNQTIPAGLKLYVTITEF